MLYLQSFGNPLKAGQPQEERLISISRVECTTERGGASTMTMIVNVGAAGSPMSLRPKKVNINRGFISDGLLSLGAV